MLINLYGAIFKYARKGQNHKSQKCFSRSDAERVSYRNNTPQPTVNYCNEFDRSWSNATRICEYTRRNKWDHRRPHFKGSQSHRQGHEWISNFLLVGLFSTYIVSEINGDFSRNSQIFPPPMRSGAPWNWYWWIGGLVDWWIVIQTPPL